MKLTNRTRAVIWTVYAMFWCAIGLARWKAGDVTEAGGSAVIAAAFLAIALGYAHRSTNP